MNWHYNKTLDRYECGRYRIYDHGFGYVMLWHRFNLINVVRDVDEAKSLVKHYEGE